MLSHSSIATQPTLKRPHKAETHRALADVRESIAEMRFYREQMLAAPDGAAR